MQVDNKDVKNRILNDPVTYSEKFSEKAKSICEGLLAKSVDDRLGFKNDSCDELRAHPFFSEINWRKLDAGMMILIIRLSRMLRTVPFTLTFSPDPLNTVGVHN